MTFYLRYMNQDNYYVKKTNSFTSNVKKATKFRTRATAWAQIDKLCKKYKQRRHDYRIFECLNQKELDRYNKDLDTNGY